MNVRDEYLFQAITLFLLALMLLLGVLSIVGEIRQRRKQEHARSAQDIAASVRREEERQRSGG